MCTSLNIGDTFYCFESKVTHWWVYVKISFGGFLFAGFIVLWSNKVLASILSPYYWEIQKIYWKTIGRFQMMTHSLLSREGCIKLQKQVNCAIHLCLSLCSHTHSSSSFITSCSTKTLFLGITQSIHVFRWCRRWHPISMCIFVFVQKMMNLRTFFSNKTRLDESQYLNKHLCWSKILDVENSYSVNKTYIKGNHTHY